MLELFSIKAPGLLAQDNAMSSMLNSVSGEVGKYLPSILSALAVLVIGWIVAKIISSLVGKGLGKSGFGQKLSRLISPDGKVNASKVISKIIFYLLMLFVLITFFQVLDLPMVSQPLNGFLDQVFEYAPRLLSALGLGVVAYVLARVLKQGTKSGLDALDLDNRVANVGQDVKMMSDAAGSALDRVAGEDDPLKTSMAEDSFDGDDDGFDFGGGGGSPSAAATSDSPGLSTSISEAVYWLVFALFLPGIIGVLQIPGLKEPIEKMFTKALDFLPNIFAALVIGVVGFFIARLVRQIVSNLTASFGVNKLASKIGLAEDGGTRISDLLGLLSFVTILLPISVEALKKLDIETISGPANQIINRVSSLVPGFLGAAITIAVAVFIGRIIAKIAVEFLAGVGFDQMPEKIGLPLSNDNPDQTPSKIGGKLVLGGIILMALSQALPMMELGPLAEHVNAFSAFAVRLVIGLVILALGMFLSTIAAKQIKGSGIENASTLAMVARGAILFFAGGFALQQIGVSQTIVNTAFMSLLGGLGVALAIAFGWGGRDAAKRFLDRHVK